MTATAKADKFAPRNKGHLVVDLDKKKMAVVGDKNSTAKEKKILKEAGIKEPKEVKEVKTPKALKTAEKEINKKLAKVAKKEAAEKTPRTPRGQFADKKIKVTNKDHGAREGSLRAALMTAIFKAKNTNDVIGTEVTAGDKTGRVSSSDINFAVNNGLISLS